MPQTVITYGAWDLFHVGHLRMLQECKAAAQGGRLIVGVGTDEFLKRENAKTPIISFAERLEIVASIACVDRAFPQNDRGDQADDLLSYRADLLILGEDWAGDLFYSKLCESCGVEFKTIERTPGISTSIIRDRIQQQGR